MNEGRGEHAKTRGERPRGARHRATRPDRRHPAFAHRHQGAPHLLTSVGLVST